MDQEQREPVANPRQSNKIGVTRLRRLLKNLFVGGAITVLLAELCLWVAFPLADPFYTSRFTRHYIRHEHEPHMNFRSVPEPGLPGMAGTSRLTTNAFGFRGDKLLVPKPIDEFRVFLIGGSTTECLALDDKDSLDAVVQRTVQERVGDGWTIRVYNTGVSGDRSDDHIAILSQRIVHLEPDLIVVFAGINDMRAAMAGHDYLHFPTRGRQPWVLLATQSQMGRLAYYVAKRRTPLRDTRDSSPIKTPYRSAVLLQQAASATSATPDTNLDAYRVNLRTLAGLARGHNIETIFMTQQTTWDSSVDPTARDWHWMLRVGDVRYSESVMNETLEQLNEVMRDVANSMSVTLYDLAKSMPKSSDYFYDDVHFNTNGARVAGIELGDLIVQHIDRSATPPAP